MCVLSFQFDEIVTTALRESQALLIAWDGEPDFLSALRSRRPLRLERGTGRATDTCGCASAFNASIV